MKNKKMIIIYISIIGLIAISLLGLTYGYVTARIDGNETSKNVSAISQVLKMEFTDGSESLTSTLEGYFNPGSELTKTFTFKNNGNKDLNYNIKDIDVIYYDNKIGTRKVEQLILTFFSLRV